MRSLVDLMILEPPLNSVWRHKYDNAGTYTYVGKYSKYGDIYLRFIYKQYTSSKWLDFSYTISTFNNSFSPLD